MRELVEIPDAADAHRARIAKALAEAEQHVERFAAAIAITGNIPAAARRLQDAERTRQDLVRQHAAVGDGPMSPASTGAW